MSGFARRSIEVLGFLLVLVAAPAGAQESLDSGKTPAQLFASDCAICHKTPQGLAKAGGLLGLDTFLRQHYTASRESAAAIAAYLQAVGRGPPAPVPGRPAKRNAKGDDKAKAAEKKPETGKSGDGKSGGGKSGDGKSGAAKPADAKSSEPKSSQPKSSEPSPSEPKASEQKPPESKPSEPKAGEGKASEPKPAEGGKSD